MTMRTEPGGLLEAGSTTPREPVGPARPRGSRGHTALAIVAVAAAIALIGAAAATVAWRDANGEATRAAVARAAANERIATLSERVDELEQQVGTDGPRLDGRLQEMHEALRAARAELAAVAGPSLADGRHLVRIVAVGDDQQPPRLIVDVQQWFTDQAAVDAAIEDGVPREDAGIDGYYIRNDSPRWRIAEVAPAAQVSLTQYPHGQIDDPGIVGLERFRTLFGSDGEYLRYSPYWITVEDGTVQQIEEKFLP